MQGLYIYRNDRLIQAGGWNDGRDTEPHTSLARAIINLPASLDSHFALDVKKASIKVPAGFAKALPEALAKDGTRFRAFTSTANKLYRRNEAANPKNQSMVPQAGFNSDLRNRLREILAPNEKRVRGVGIEWATLDSAGFFELDRENRTIRLNKIYRLRVLGSRRASAADAPLVKALIFLLLSSDLDSGRVSAGQKEWLSQCSLALAAAARSMTADGD